MWVQEVPGPDGGRRVGLQVPRSGSSCSVLSFCLSRCRSRTRKWTSPKCPPSAARKQILSISQVGILPFPHRLSAEGEVVYALPCSTEVVQGLCCSQAVFPEGLPGFVVVLSAEEGWEMPYPGGNPLKCLDRHRGCFWGVEALFTLGLLQGCAGEGAMGG